MPGTTLNALPLLNFTPTLEVDTIIIPHLIDDKPEAEGLGNSLQGSLDALLRSQGAALGLQQDSLAGDPGPCVGQAKSSPLFCWLCVSL